MKRGLIGYHTTVSEYLMRMLNIDEETLNLLITKSPAILRVNVSKLKRLINVLHNNGITSDEILQHKRIFFFNVETIENRIMRLKKEGLSLRMTPLVASEEWFERYVTVTRTIMQCS